MDDDDPITGEFHADSTWALSDDYGFFGSINESRDNNILSEFGWNLNPSQQELNRIDSNSSSRCEVPENPYQVKAQSKSIETSGDVSMSTPLPSSSSSDDRPASSSAASGDAVTTTGKPRLLSNAGGKVKKKGPKRIRQQRFAFMTKTDIDHLEDGYRWRKYGQKAVKNSPFPRSYYRCTNSKCTVKKRVERSSTDPTTVITTYEGQHCHHTVGFPRGLINHEGSYTRYSPSLTSQPFIYPRAQLPQVADQNASQSQQVVSSELRDLISHEKPQPQPQASFQDSRVDQGLLGDIVPPIMRN